MNLSRIGKRLWLAREERGWTQQQLAKAAGVSVGTLQALEEAGKPDGTIRRQTTVERIEKIAKALGYTIDQLLAEATTVKPSDPRLRGLTEEALQIARIYMQAETEVRLHVRDVLTGEITIPSKFATLTQHGEALVTNLERRANQTDEPTQTKTRTEGVAKPKHKGR